MTKIIHYNIAPTRSEKKLKLADAEFLYVMMNSVIIDVAECILNEMVFFKEKAPSRANMPFMAMISSICLAAGAPLIDDPLIQPPIGPITMTSVKKSSVMSRPPKVSQSASVNVPPSFEIPPNFPSSSTAPPPKKKKSWKVRIEGYIKKLLCRQSDFKHWTVLLPSRAVLSLICQLVGSLIYLTVTRPDIAHAIHIVNQFMSAPRSTHYATVLRILRYVKGTLFHGLHFSSQSSLQLHAYSDAAWAGDPTDRCSTTGFCFFLRDSLISWRRKKQTLVAHSSTEAEYRALADTMQELLWLRWLLQDMGISHSGDTMLHCDNCSVILIAHNDVFHDRTKHIEIDCHFIRQHVVRGTVHLLSVSSADQTADIFTKSLLPCRFDARITKLKLVSAKPP
ncbi:hypothetical protein Acr_00g0021800 [Actinidia rufa]|uniref:Uncharacterized protein n=1 Tax=Actinidia rufa TaxID=165716 RepID=A0A7J0DCJ3_9ERIC|nr:hypothetical protein Acr_00g0021800 [Actinidia rufa]